MRAVAVFILGAAIGWLLAPSVPAHELEIPAERLAVLDLAEPAPRAVPAVTWTVWPATWTRAE